MNAARIWLACACRRLSIGLVTALLIAGCSRDTADLEEFMREVRARPPAPIEPIPEMRTFATFEYPATGLRDPFAAPKPQTARSPRSDGPRPDPNRPREALEQFPLDSLRMMGTLRQQDKLWGLVRDTSGTVHRVEIGNYLGRNHGRIVKIDETSIAVRELIPDGNGGWIERNAALAVRE